MIPLNVEQDFFEALQHHPYNLVEFLLYKQKESGWSKDAYLNQMEGLLSREDAKLYLLIRKEKEANPNIDKSQIGQPLEEITNGKVKEYFVLRTHNRTTIFNEDVIDTFKFYLKKAKSFTEKEPIYSDLQILSFAFKALQFIHGQFEIQTGNKKRDSFFAHVPKDYKPISDKGEPVYLIHTFYVSVPTPVFDFFLFADSLRNLILNSAHPEHLHSMTLPIRDFAKKIVTLWNNKLSKIVQMEENEGRRPPGKDNVNRIIIPVSFDPHTRQFTTYHDLVPFVWDTHKYYDNYMFAVFARNVGNLIENDVPGFNDKSKKEFPELVKSNPITGKLLLLYLYHRDGQTLNKIRHISKVQKVLNVKEASLTNDYRELTYYVNGVENLSEREYSTWEKYNARLNDPDIRAMIKQLNID